MCKHMVRMQDKLRSRCSQSHRAPPPLRSDPGTLVVLARTLRQKPCGDAHQMVFCSRSKIPAVASILYHFRSTPDANAIFGLRDISSQRSAHWHELSKARVVSNEQPTKPESVEHSTSLSSSATPCLTRAKSWRNSRPRFRRRNWVSPLSSVFGVPSAFSKPLSSAAFRNSETARW